MTQPIKRLACGLTLTLLALLIAGCAPSQPASWQGYLEGDYVYVSSPLSGRLETLAVTKGNFVKRGTPLFTLEREAELDAQRQASAQLDAARARLADSQKGARPSELSSYEARLNQARATAELSSLDFARQESLYRTKAISQSDYDRARLTNEANQRAVEQAASDLATARLGARMDAVAAAAATVQADEAAKAKADWNVNQKSQESPCDALVYDTLYRQGELVPAGLPVVSLLPPENLKVRFYVTEEDYGKLKVGTPLLVGMSGHDKPLKARVSYLSPQPEYTPPILFNRDNRSKLVFMAEGLFEPAVARDLHPGQPVDVRRDE